MSLSFGTNNPLTAHVRCYRLMSCCNELWRVQYLLDDVMQNIVQIYVSA